MLSDFVTYHLTQPPSEWVLVPRSQTPPCTHSNLLYLFSLNFKLKQHNITQSRIKVKTKMFCETEERGIYFICYHSHCLEVECLCSSLP